MDRGDALKQHHGSLGQNKKEVSCWIGGGRRGKHGRVEVDAEGGLVRTALRRHEVGVGRWQQEIVGNDAEARGT